MSILVIGASGLLGSNICMELQINKQEFIAASRNPELLKMKLGFPTQVIKANLDSAESYIPALKNCDTIVISAHALLERGARASQIADRDGIINLIRLAKEYKIRNIILFSIYGASLSHPLEFFRNKAAAEFNLAKSGIPYTIIQCPAFMELHISELMGKDILSRKSVKMLGAGKVKSNFVSVADLAQFTIRLLAAPALNKTIILSSPDHLSKREVVDLYGSILGTKPKVMSIPVSVLNVLSKLIEPFHSGVARLLKMAAYLDKEGANITYTNWPFNIKVTTVKDFVWQHISRKG